MKARLLSRSLTFITIFFFGFVIGLPFMAVAQSQRVDLAFNPMDVGFASGSGLTGLVRAVAVQSDKKILAGGDFTSHNGATKGGITRLNTDGSQDFTFNVGSGTNNPVAAIAIQPDGKIIIGGDFTSFNGTNVLRLARLNTDGSIDASFTIGTGFNSLINTLAIQPDGKILVGGWFTTFNGVTRKNLLRLNSNGSLDNTFNLTTELDAPINSIALQSTNKIVIGGLILKRLNTDGSTDESFAIGTGPNQPVNTIVVQTDDKILIGGEFASFNGTARKRIARLESSGSLDLTFTPEDISDDIFSIVLKDNKVLIGGSFTQVNGVTRNFIARLNSTGISDLTFDAGTAFNNTVRVLAYSDNQLVAGGQFTSSRKYINMLGPDGAPVDNFGTPVVISGANSYILKNLVQADKKIMIVGAFTKYDGVTRNNIARLNENGGLDTSFDPGSGANGIVYNVIRLSDGSYIVVGAFTTFNGVSRNRIVKLSSTGTVDETFTIGTGANNIIGQILLQSDDKLVITGLFTQYNGVARGRIARLNTTGSLDMTFDPGTGANNGISAIQPDADGKFLIGGTFTEFNGTSKKYFARLNSNGSLDGTFQSGNGPDAYVSDISKLPDGKTIISGNFTDYNNFIGPKITRINADGTKDNTFSTGSGPNREIYDHVISPDGKIIISGPFNDINGVTRNGIAVLNADGTNSTLLTPGQGANAIINSLSVIDNKLIISGFFTAFEGVGRSFIARIILMKQDQTITFTAIPDKLASDGPFELSPSSTSDLTVALTSLSAHISITGNVASIIDAGSVIIHADQAGDVSFNAAPRVSNTFCIDPVKPVITKIGDREFQSSSLNANYWFRNGVQISGLASRTLTATASGIYTAQVNVEGCKSEFSEAEVLVITGAEDDVLLQGVKIFPNPVTDQLNIDLNSLASGREVTIQLFDSMGGVLQEWSASGGQVIQHSVAAYRTGLYFAKINYKKSTQYLKFVKH